MQLCFSVVGQLIKSTVIMWSLCKWNRDCEGCYDRRVCLVYVHVVGCSACFSLFVPVSV